MMNSNVATEEYTNLVYETSRERITLAGYRLANYVIDIFDPSRTYQPLSFDQIEKELMKLVK